MGKLYASLFGSFCRWDFSKADLETVDNDHGAVATPALVEGGVERHSTNSKPMATPIKAAKIHAHYLDFPYLALWRLLCRRPTHLHSSLEH